MATEKILNTRIINKHAELLGEKGWENSTLQLKEGEIALAKVTLTEQHAGGQISEVPAYLVKIGVEGKTFNETAWAYAKAADVHAWAKEASKPSYTASEITGIESFIANYVEDTMGISVDTNTVYRIVATETGYKLQSKGATDADTAWADVTGSIIDLSAYAKTAEIEQIYATITNLENEAKTRKEADDALSDRIKVFEDKSLSEVGHEHTSDNITDFDTAVAAIKVTNAANADNATHATNADTATNATDASNAAKLEGKAIADIKTDFTGAIADGNEGFVTGDAVYDVKVTADAAKARIDAFIDGTAEADSAIDTLVEIQQFMTDDTGAFVALSNKVTNIENGTTTVPKATHAVNADNATKAADSDKLGGQAPAYYATAASVTDITKTGGAIDTKIATLDTTVTGMGAGKTIATLTETDGKIAATFQDIAITKSQITDFSDDDYAKPSDLDNTVISVERRLDTSWIPGATEDGNVTQNTDVNEVNIPLYITTKDGTETSCDNHGLAGGEGIQLSVTSSVFTNTTTRIRVADKGITTAKIADHAVGAAQIKAEQSYTGTDAEVWVFDCGGAE